MFNTSKTKKKKNDWQCFITLSFDDFSAKNFGGEYRKARHVVDVDSSKIMIHFTRNFRHNFRVKSLRTEVGVSTSRVSLSFRILCYSCRKLKIYTFEVLGSVYPQRAYCLPGTCACIPAVMHVPVVVCNCFNLRHVGLSDTNYCGATVSPVAIVL